MGTRGSLEKRSLTLAGHATSVALEPLFWRALEAWAAREGMSVPHLIATIDAGRTAGPLSSALRVAILEDALGRSHH
ncbi:MAG: ribbon-helix-helix domain-containing protein [Pseudomonadota bacterium]